MPVINVAYEINQTVFVVSLESGVQEGIVRSSNVDITPTSTTITYDVAYKMPQVGNGSTTADQDDTYADVDTALAAYKVLIEC